MASDRLDLPAWSVDSLKAIAIQQRLPRPRSLAWAILLNALPPPNMDIVSSLKSHRNFYNDLSDKLSMDPRAVIGDDPLSQDDESVWKQHFCDNELKTLILQDVVRTFPEELYFREKDVQDLMNPNEVIRYLDKVREEFLVPLDLELSAHLVECNISMELFGIRWLRLLFGREFPRSEIPNLWGFLFADGPMFPNLHYVIVAMLISMRNTLLDPDPGVILSALMRPVCLCVGYKHSSISFIVRSTEHAASEPRDWREMGGAGSESGSEGVAEGADVARELAALALLRAQLPPAAAALAAALPRPPPHVQQPLQQILHLAALLQCRNHALIDVETALEAAEGQTTEKVGRRQLIPVAMIHKPPQKPNIKPLNKVKEVPLKVFHQGESVASDLPFLDPLRLRTE
ncbi:hypothetical protein HF086_012867 [Spodoptera exigua]|uniref:Rab-GAP TBC domain-containing protein n=1 Tax=Spodoptera exigua TaxID=7107 RepID=A0A922SMG7_SPOEX|nr:hypothetical protein HF086_012867 [Spodoptera exigua]